MKPSYSEDSDRSRDKLSIERNASERVKVYVRLRPYTEDEYMQDRQSCIESFDLDSKSIVGIACFVSLRDYIGICLVKRDLERKKFKFDDLADPKLDQSEVYKTLAQPVVQSVLNGYNGTIFAYGQVIYRTLWGFICD